MSGHCSAIVSINAQPDKHHDHAHPLSVQQGVAKIQHRCQDGEELSGGGDDGGGEGPKVSHCQEDEVLK